MINAKGRHRELIMGLRRTKATKCATNPMINGVPGHLAAPGRLIVPGQLTAPAANVSQAFGSPLL